LSAACRDSNADAEALPPGKRQLEQDTTHGMDYEDSFERLNEDGMEDDDTGDRALSRLEVIDAAIERQKRLTAEEQLRERQNMTTAVQKICQARSMSAVLQLMDTMIDDSWLGGIDALPGDIYSVAAFSLTALIERALDCPSILVSLKTMAAIFGFVCIFLIQLVGPLMIFFNRTYGIASDKDDMLKFENMRFDTEEWFTERRYTKLLGLLFVICFILNGLFVQLDEGASWRKIDRIFRILNVNGEMQGTCEGALQLGAFMNFWVIAWLSLDVYFICGLAENAQDVLFDALALTFLYNLDEISGDLGFVNDDDWPGLELAWLDAHIGEVAMELPDISETDPSTFCSIWLKLSSFVLAVMALVIPTAFAFTPFKSLMPDEDEVMKGKVLEVLQASGFAHLLANGTIDQLKSVAEL